MTPKRWLIAGAGSVVLLFILQRMLLFGLVGLERAIVGALIVVEDAILGAFFSTARVVIVAYLQSLPFYP